MGLTRPVAAVPVKKPAAVTEHAKRAERPKVVRKPAVRRGKESKLPTTPVKATVRSAKRAAPTKPLAESPMPPPAPSVVLDDPLPKPVKVKPVIDRRFGYQGITR